MVVDMSEACRMHGLGFGEDDDEANGAPKTKGSCYRCGQDGHWARSCKGQSTSGCTLFIVIDYLAAACLTGGLCRLLLL